MPWRFIFGMHRPSDYATPLTRERSMVSRAGTLQPIFPSTGHANMPISPEPVCEPIAGTRLAKVKRVQRQRDTETSC
jgi:hypothetical protein